MLRNQRSLREEVAIIARGLAGLYRSLTGRSRDSDKRESPRERGIPWPDEFKGDSGK